MRRLNEKETILVHGDKIIKEDIKMSKKENKNPNVGNEEMENVNVVPDENTAPNAEENTETMPIIGVVTDCLRLNIRKKPDAGAKILGEVEALSEVTVDPDKSTDEWFSVCTEAGIEGFCVKKFIVIRQ